MFDQKNIYPATERWLENIAEPYLASLREEHQQLLAAHQEATGGDCYLVGGAIFGPWHAAASNQQAQAPTGKPAADAPRLDGQL